MIKTKNDKRIINNKMVYQEEGFIEKIKENLKEETKEKTIEKTIEKSVSLKRTCYSPNRKRKGVFLRVIKGT